MALRITKAAPEHIFYIRMLWERLMEETHEEYPVLTWPKEGDNFTRAIVRAMQGPEQLFAVFLATVGKKVVGFIAAEVCYRAIGMPHWYGVAHWMYVRPEHRGKGVASALAREAIAWVRSYPIPVEEGNSHHTTTIDTIELSATYGARAWEAWGPKPFRSTFYCKISDIALQRPAMVKKLPSVEQDAPRKGAQNG